MHKYLLLIIVFLSTATLLAQKSRVTIKDDSVYLGRIPIKNSIRHQFEFEVKPGSQAQIKEVKSDCACSILSYPEHVLRPKQKGVILIEFEPYKPGPFEKRFIVSWEGSSVEDELILKGYIEPSIVSYKMDFPVEWGSLRLKHRVVAFGNIANQDVVKRKVEVYNPSSLAITFEDSIISPNYIEVLWDKKTVEPMGKASFDVYYNPKLKNDFGFSVDNVVFFTNHPSVPNLSLDVSSVVYAGAEAIKKHIPKRPQIWVSSDTLDLGKVFTNNSYMVSFAVYNRGKDKLVLNNVIPDVDCELMELEKQELEQNEYSNVKIKISNLFKKAGLQYRTIKVLSNDPNEKEKVLTIKAEVIK